MPSYRVHLLGGIASYALMYTLLNRGMPSRLAASLTVQTMLLSFALLGSIFPDIDIGSKMRRFFLLSLIIAVPIALLHNKASFIAIASFCVFFLIIPHRSITHAIWFIIAFPSALSLMLIAQSPASGNLIMLSCAYFIVGALSHRLLDLGFKRFF